jgi:hypothetical protein
MDLNFTDELSSFTAATISAPNPSSLPCSVSFVAHTQDDVPIEDSGAQSAARCETCSLPPTPIDPPSVQLNPLHPHTRCSGGLDIFLILQIRNIAHVRQRNHLK